MKQYKFLLKPLFFIFNLVFATWLVLEIEKLKPSDFGEHNTLFNPAPKPRIVTEDDKRVLRAIALEFKYGLIDSVKMEQRLDAFLAPPKQQSPDEIIAESKNKN
jgi:hypothetical protein